MAAGRSFRDTGPITDDGYTYERELLERLKKENKKCSLDSTKTVDNIIPNHLLRGEIITYLEEKEKINKEEKNELNTSTTSSLRGCSKSLN